MNNIVIEVTNTDIKLIHSDRIKSKSVGDTYCQFQFSADCAEEWAELSKSGVFYQDKDHAAIWPLDENNGCIVPATALELNTWLLVGIYGDIIDGETTTKRKTVEWATVPVYEGAYDVRALPMDPPASVYDIIVNMMINQAVAADEAKAAETETKAARDTALQAAANAIEKAAEALESAGKAEESEDNAEEYMQSALQAMQTATQAMSDLIAMMGSDIATLTGGKLTPSQIPAIAVTDTFVVSSESAMLSLDAQTGDVCIRTDQSKSYILQGADPTVLSSWKHLQSPTNYADTAGHAATADNATNADKINNKRIVGMTQSQYESAVLDDNTFYFVVPD